MYSSPAPIIPTKMLFTVSSLAVLAASATSSIVPSAVFPAAFSPANEQACLKASSFVSCQTKAAVDPLSFATCCYNGALKPGFKESGLVLATQFWDTDPSTGPADSTTIHGEASPAPSTRQRGADLLVCRFTGLWPDYCDGSYPAVSLARGFINKRVSSDKTPPSSRAQPILAFPP